MSNPSFRYALSLFVVMRVVISLWSTLVLAVTLAPTTPDDVLRPHQGGDPISGGAAEVLLGLFAQSDVQQAVDDAQRVWFVVLQRALDEAAELGTENPGKSWLDAHYGLTDTTTCHDLMICPYERS